MQQFLHNTKVKTVPCFGSLVFLRKKHGSNFKPIYPNYISFPYDSWFVDLWVKLQRTHVIIESGYRGQRLNCLQTFKRHALTHFTHSHTYAGSCQALYTHISMSAYKASESRHRLHLHKHKNFTSIDPKQLKQYQCKNLLSHMNQALKVQGYTFKVEKYTSEVQKYTFEEQKYTFEVQKYIF